MNPTLLNTEIQAFINNNINSEIAKLILGGTTFNDVDTKEVIEQIEAKKRSVKKLPTWFKKENIYWPNKLNIEQTSSEITAKYKSTIISGKSLIDVTGGFGVDTYYFSQHVDSVIHCEIDNKLSKIVAHNFKELEISNIKCLNESGIDALKRLDQQFDWVYVDPSRRDKTKNKVFLLTDCTPDVKIFQHLFLVYAKNVMVKTSPLLDISATLFALNHITEIYVVAVNNEVKELLWILQRDYEGDVLIKTINLQKDKNPQIYNFKLADEAINIAQYHLPLNYLYEPNSAILKAGAFNSLSYDLDVYKLHKHSHLYTSKELIDFPGRRFKIEKILPFNKKLFAKEKITKGNITTRNFPLTVAEIRKKFKIKDGGDIYLFFTTNLDEEKTIVVCSKI